VFVFLSCFLLSILIYGATLIRNLKILDMKKDTKLKGKRYSKQERRDVLSYVAEHNESHGRGGITTAVKKYGISAVTIRNWMSDTTVGAAKPSHTQEGDLYRQLADLTDAIHKLETDLENKHTELKLLKKRLL